VERGEIREENRAARDENFLIEIEHDILFGLSGRADGNRLELPREKSGRAFEFELVAASGDVFEFVKAVFVREDAASFVRLKARERDRYVRAVCASESKGC
jgi:hypothetical protein